MLSRSATCGQSQRVSPFGGCIWYRNRGVAHNAKTTHQRIDLFHLPGVQDSSLAALDFLCVTEPSPTSSAA